MAYCTVTNVQAILPEEVIIGTNLMEENVNVLTADAQIWVDHAANIVDSYLASIYRIPLILYKKPDYTADPVTFTEEYPPPIPLINARIAAAFIYDNIIMSQQEPNVSEWGSNQRALAFDDLVSVQSGATILHNQVRTGRRFVRQELLDSSRVTIKPEIQGHTRAPGL